MTTAVVGGGIAGALTARALRQQGEEVVVLDAGDRPGGLMVPVEKNGFLLEPGAGSVLLPHHRLSALVEGLDLDISPVGPVGQRRWVRHRGRTIQLQMSPRLLTSGILSAGGWLKMALEPFAQHDIDDPSLERFLVGRLGREAGRLAAWLVATGVHAGDPRQLAASETVPRLVEAAARHGSLAKAMRRRPRPSVRPSTHVIGGGTASIAAAISKELGGDWRPGFRVDRLEAVDSRWRVHGPEAIEADRVIAAIAPAALPAILGLDLPSAPTDHAPVAVVFLGTTRPLPDAIGALVGPDEPMSTLGFLFESSYAPGRAPAGNGLVKAVVGGAGSPHLVDLSDSELAALVVADLGELLGASPRVQMTHVIRHRPGIPQYTPARRDAIAALRPALPAGLDVVGWEYDGVGLGGLAGAAARIASVAHPTRDG